MTTGVEESDTVVVQPAPVQLDKEHIALYRGSREFQTISVEYYCTGNYRLSWIFTHFSSVDFEIQVDVN